MNFTVYCMGDLEIFVSVLNAVAMAFGSSLFDPAQGAGVIVVGMLIGIIFMILPATIAKGVDPKPFFFVILLFFGGVVPKERVQVEDVFTGNATAVDNVPLIVALPASLVATLSKALTDEIETSFTTTSGTYLAMGQEGFVNPLKLLLSLRNPVTNKRTYPYFSASLTEFVKYCAPTDPAFNVKAMSAAPDIIAYLQNLGAVHGVMTYYGTGEPQGLGTSCADGIDRIAADAAAIPAGGEITELLGAQTAGEFAANPAANGATVAGLDNAYNGVTAGIVANAQNSQQFMINMIAMTPVTQGVDCINQPTGPNMAECTSAIMTREALERANADAAGQASMFAKTAIPTMNWMLALFYAFSPLVIGIAFMSASHGIKILLGYLMFGACTQSWMPVAAVINYMIQLQTQYAISSFSSSGITMENYMQFYSVVTMKVGAASEFMASSFMLTMALLSGSMIALSNLASKTTGKDHFDETTVAPKILNQASVVENGAAVSKQPVMRLGQTGLGLVGATYTTDQTPGNQVYSNLDISNAADMAHQRDRTHAKAARESLESTKSKGASRGFSKDQMETLQKQSAEEASYMEGTESAVIHQLVAEMAKGKNWSSSKIRATESAIRASASAGVNVFGSGMTVAASTGLSDTHSASEIEQINSILKGSDASSHKAVQAAQQSWKRANIKNVSTANGQRDMLSLQSDLKSGAAQVEEAQERESESARVSSGIRLMKNMGSNQIAAQANRVAGDSRARAMLNLAASKAGIANFDSLIKSKVGDFAGTAEDQATKEFAAGAEILASHGDTGASEMVGLLNELRIIPTASGRGMSSEGQEQYGRLKEMGSQVADKARQGVANVEKQTDAAKENVQTPMDTLSSGEEQKLRNQDTKAIPASVKQGPAPLAKEREAAELAKTLEIGDQTKVIIQALTNAGMMVAGGAAGKVAGEMIAKASPAAREALAQMSQKMNPGQLGTDAKLVSSMNAEGQELLSKLLAEGGKHGGMAGQVAGDAAAKGVHLTGSSGTIERGDELLQPVTVGEVEIIQEPAPQAGSQGVDAAGGVEATKTMPVTETKEIKQKRDHSLSLGHQEPKEGGKPRGRTPRDGG